MGRPMAKDRRVGSRSGAKYLPAAPAGWWTLACVRVHVVNQLEAEISQIWRQCLSMFFGRASGKGDLRQGVTMDRRAQQGTGVHVLLCACVVQCVSGDGCMLLCVRYHEDLSDGLEPIVLRAKHGVSLGDEVGLKEAFGCKGHAGIKPCVCCGNILKLGNFRATKDGPLLDIGSLKVDLFELHDDETVLAIMRRLQTAAADTSVGHVKRCSRGPHSVDLVFWLVYTFMYIHAHPLRACRLKALEENLGWNVNAEGWLGAVARGLDIPCEIASTCHYDPVHCYLEGGVFVVEVNMGGISATALGYG